MTLHYAFDRLTLQNDSGQDFVTDSFGNARCVPAIMYVGADEQDALEFYGIEVQAAAKELATLQARTQQ